LEGTKLSEWLCSPSSSGKIKSILKILSIIIPLNILLLVLFTAEVLPAYWAIGIVIYTGIYLFNSKYIKELFDKSLDIQTDFGRLSRILEFLENYPALKSVRNEKLNQMCGIFFKNKNTPSSYFKKLNMVTFAASFQKNPFFFLLLNSFFPYDFFFAFKLEKLKLELKDKLPVWLGIFYDLEAFISLSNFAYINPDYCFPSISTEKQKFIAEKLAHPLIPADSNIHNNFSLGKKAEVVIITGSNMSGKSTFLKTVGVNLVLAFAGSVVNSSKLETSLFKIFTCINISDSITDGISYFYAEVKRLKNLLNEIKMENEIMVFYLIDEIFKGTNNMERLIGSRSYIKKLAGLNGTGLISTHDLELIKLEENIPQVSNYHFREEVSNGRMQFDYKLRKGPSPTTNALKIMEIEGLPVEK
jgi:energy-coupling factor transporter ATP-binding protein EcfA2